MKVLGIDIGSSFLKAAVIDLDQALIVDEQKVKAPEKTVYDDPNLFEVPAKYYTEYVLGAVDEMAAKYEDLQSVILSTQMHGFIYAVPGVEDAYISWQDMRCLHETKDGNYLDRLARILPRERMEDNGVYLKPALGCANLYALLDEHPELPRNGTLYTLGSYLIARMTGNNCCHETNAGPLGLLNVREHCWNEDVLNALGLGEVTLPKLAEGDYDCCGYYRTANRSIAVFPDYGDQQVAVVGCLPQKGEGLINIATASQVGMLSDEYKTGRYEVRPYFEGTYLRTISNMPAGRGLDVLINFLRGTVKLLTGTELSIGEVWKKIDEGFRQQTDGIAVDMTFYATTEKPDGGAITGIHQSNFNVNTLISAAFSDMAATYKKNLLILNGGQALTSVVCSGGVSWKQPALRAVIAQTLGCACRLSALEDEVMSGMYRIGLCCMKKSKSIYDEPERMLQLH